MDSSGLAHFAIVLMLGLELKHFVADYLLQFDWMIRGKGSFVAPGGYVHAGLHAIGSLAVLALIGIPVVMLWSLVVIEFAIHYLLDFAKAHYGDHVSSRDAPRKFWALNGLDQFFHHLTYLGMTWIVVTFA